MSITGERHARPSTGGFQPRTADQLPRPTQEPERQVGRGLVALLGAAVLMLGVPALLVFFVGNPLPTTLPDRSWLQADLTAGAIIKVFAVLVWIVWAHFVVCMLAELRALRAGRMPGVVPLGGGSQLVARRLIAGILLLVGTATMTGNVPASTGPGETTVVSTSTQSGRAPAALAELRLDTDSSGSGPGSPLSESAAAAADGVGQAAQGAAGAAATADVPVIKYYEVKPPSGRNYDTLWDISQRHLGDPFRYKEIFELNRDRAQPDGRRLVDADLIHPGWQLIMPLDAEGPDILTVRPQTPGAATTEGATPAATGAGETSAAADAGSRTDAGAGAAQAGLDVGGATLGSSRPAGPSVPTVQQTQATSAVRSGDLGEMMLGGGLVLAGLLLALSTRRGAYGTPDGADQALRLAARPERADLLDRALRALAEGRSAQRLPLPDVSAVYVNDDQVVVHVAGRPPAPPAPWHQADEGRSWTVRREQLEGFDPRGPAPWPALVNIAESHGYDLLVDLELAPGLISLAGSPEVSREIALSLAVDLVTHPWSDSVSVTLVGFGGDLSELAPERIHHVASIEEAVGRAQRVTTEQDRLLHSLGADGVLAGRAAGRVHELRPHVLILSGTPSEDQAALLNDLTAHGRSVLTAVCVGNTLAARWRFTADTGGGVDLGALGMSGIARRITPAALDSVQGLLREAGVEAGQRAAEAAVRQPAAVASGVARPARPEPVDRDRAAARVELLGPVRIQATGSASAARVALLTELVTMVGLHPDGVHESVLRVGLWPRGVDDDVVQATLAAAQQWLGTDPSGADLLARGEDGRWRLSPAVHVDWHELADVAADHQDDPHRLLAALGMARGPAFSAVPPGRYAWLAFHLAAREARVLITTMSRRAAGQLVAAGDRGSAEQALRLGLTLVPGAQALWRDLVRLLGDGGPAPVAGLVEEMRQALAGSPWEPETEALLDHVDPRQGKIS